MNDRIELAARSPLVAAQLCREAPGSLVHALAEYRGLSSANRARVDALLEDAASDPDLGCRLVGLVRHEGFQACDEGHQALLLDLLAGQPEADTLGRFEELASDAEFRRMMPREATRQAAEVRDRTAFPDVTAMVRRSGARAHEPHGFSLPGAIELGAHAFEIVVDLALEHVAQAGLISAASTAGTTVVAGVPPAVASIVAVGAGLWGLSRDHAAGREWGEAVAEGRGFIDQMAHHLRGDDPVPGRGARGTGAAAADRYWESLSPAQRVELRTVDGLDHVLRGLAASVDRITMTAREGD